MDALTIKLPAELEISSVAQFHTSLVDTLSQRETEQHLHLDASELRRIDTAGIQLLVALVREATAQNLKLTCQKPSNEFIQCAERLGLSDILLTTNS